MPAANEVQAFAEALNRLSDRAKRQILVMWRPVAGAPLADQMAALTADFPQLIGANAELAVALAADLFELWAEELGVRNPTPALADAVSEDEAAARARWALTTENPEGNLSVLIDELIKGPARATMADSAFANGLRWARVPSGSETCAFCLMLGSRGAVYHSAETAGELSRYHGDCDCQVVPVRGPEDYPAGYDPDALYDEYVKNYYE